MKTITLYDMNGDVYYKSLLVDNKINKENLSNIKGVLIDHLTDWVENQNYTDEQETVSNLANIIRFVKDVNNAKSLLEMSHVMIYMGYDVVINDDGFDEIERKK